MPIQFLFNVSDDLDELHGLDEKRQSRGATRRLLFDSVMENELVLDGKRQGHIIGMGKK